MRARLALLAVATLVTSALTLAACKWNAPLLIVRDGGWDEDAATDADPRCIRPATADAGGLSEGLIAWYRCEAARGTSATVLADSSPLGHDARLVTGAGGASGYSFAPGKVGNALRLSYTNKGYVALPAGLLRDACEATIATWVYVNSNVNAWTRIWDFGQDTTTYMFLTPITNLDNLARFGISVAGNTQEQTIKGQTAVPTLKWTHVAVVLGPAGGTLYLDGAPVETNATMTLRPIDLGSTMNNFIGRSQFSDDPYLDADIDEFRVYDRALSPDEIRSLANGS